MYLNRELESLQQSLINLDENHQVPAQDHAHLFLSPSDLGVIRNYGRLGARYAPQAVLYQLKKLNRLSDIPITYQSTYTFSSSLEAEKVQDDQSFSAEQEKQSQLICQSLKNKNLKKSVQIGGGHDHVYPLLMGIKSAFDLSKKTLLILNLDAHLDTRQDSSFHSGTPFRQFDQQLSQGEKVHLIQFGIHHANNSLSTKHDLKNIKQKVYYSEQMSQYSASNFLAEIQNDLNLPWKETIFLLSVDCDAFGPEYFSGVSAVNGHGLQTQFFFDLLHMTKPFEFHSRLMGLYEYNPLYDDLSCKGARFLAQTIFKFVN